MMKSYGIQYSSAGENIAKGQRSSQEVMTSWMNSEGHRANILSSAFNQIGVGYYNGLWVQEFIKSNVANPPTPKAAPKASSQYYTVKKGDTFYIISKKYGITLNQIKVLNPKVTNFNRLSVGQRIRVAANIHTVKSGETAWVIAKKYGMTSSELANLNPQDSNLATLTVGQKLYVR